MKRLSVVLSAIAAAPCDGACSDTQQVTKFSEELLLTAVDVRKQAIRTALDGIERVEELWVGDFILDGGESRRSAAAPPQRFGPGRVIRVIRVLGFDMCLESSAPAVT